MRVRQDTAPHLFAVESETDSEQWYQVFANGRSEEHTSELQSPCNLVCRLILSEEHTSELQSPCNLVCRLLLEKKNPREIPPQSLLLIHDNQPDQPMYPNLSAHHPHDPQCGLQ